MIRGYNTRVSHNKIHNCPHAALGFSGNDHIIEYNEIFDALKQTDDMGAIYTGRAKIDRGTVIRNNYIHDLYTDSTNSAGIFGIYLDDKMDSITIESNVFENIAGSAVFVNGGRDNTVQDNVLINVQNSNFRISAQGVVMGETVEGNLMQYSGMQDGKYKTEPYTKYPHLADILEDEPLYPKYNVFNNNVSVNGATDFFYDLWGRAEKTVVTDRNTMNDTYTYKKDPGFADYAKRNYTIKEDSELMKIEGFKAPDFAGMGLFTEWLSYKLADTVSMKINSPITSNGFDNEYVDNDNIAVTPIIVDNSTYVPIRYLAEALGGDAEFDSEKRIAAINVSGKKVEINLTEGTISVGGTALEGAAAIVRNNRTLVPVRALSEILSKYVEWHDCGIVIISDRETVLDKEKDSVYKWFRCRDIDGEYAEIENADKAEYTLTADDENMYLKFGVLPCADSFAKNQGEKMYMSKAFVGAFEPKALNVKIEGTVKYGEKLTVKYDFKDENTADSEGESEILWYSQIGEGKEITVDEKFDNCDIYVTVVPVSDKEPKKRRGCKKRHGCRHAKAVCGQCICKRKHNSRTDSHGILFISRQKQRRRGRKHKGLVSGRAEDCRRRYPEAHRRVCRENDMFWCDPHKRQRSF